MFLVRGNECIKAAFEKGGPTRSLYKKKDGDKEVWKNSVRGYCCEWVGRYTAIVGVLVPGSFVIRVLDGVCGWKRRFLMCGRACCVLDDVGWGCWGGV